MWLEEAREALSLQCLAASIEPKITSLGNRLGVVWRNLTEITVSIARLAEHFLVAMRLRVNSPQTRL